MKTLRFLIISMLIALAGTNFMEAARASVGSCKKHRHLHTRPAKCKTKCKKGKCKTKCTPPKTICVWDKGWPKKAKTAKPASQSGPSILNNMRADMPVRFYTAADKTTEVSSTLASVNGVPTINANDGENENYTVNIPATAAYVVAGPYDDDDLDLDDATAEAAVVATGKTYTIDLNSTNDGLVINTL